MPIPKPHEGEKVAEFVSRCMGDKVMNREYPKRDERAAICYDTYRRAKYKKKK